MPVELRKRKAAAPAPEPPAKKPSKVGKTAAKVKDVAKETAAKVAGTANGSSKKTVPKPAAAAAAAATSGKPVEGDVISLDGFGGEIDTHDGTKTTLKALVDESKAGVVLFTYPKASTPGCESLVLAHPCKRAPLLYLVIKPPSTCARSLVSDLVKPPAQAPHRPASSGTRTSP